MGGRGDLRNWTEYPGCATSAVRPVASAGRRGHQTSEEQEGCDGEEHATNEEGDETNETTKRYDSRADERCHMGGRCPRLHPPGQQGPNQQSEQDWRPDEHEDDPSVPLEDRLGHTREARAQHHLTGGTTDCWAHLIGGIDRQQGRRSCCHRGE
jgi:hypothetical protein